jgi:glycosyltransferase involved in cell wall biosynthesis
MDIDFSVVIPAYNEALYLEPTLQSVRNQDFAGNVELIVVDNNSSDDTGNLARRYADLVLYYGDRQGASAARQHGAKRARGKNLVFLDADTEMSPNLLSEAARSLQAGYVGGRAPISIADDSFGARWTELVLNSWHRFIGPMFGPYLYCRRDVFERTGGWDLHITCAEEVRLQRRLLAYGKLAWDLEGRITTDARRFKSEGYYLLALKGMLAQFFGVNLAWPPIRALPPASELMELEVQSSARAQKLGGRAAGAVVGRRLASPTLERAVE